MKRRLLNIAIVLLAGAVLNHLVASLFILLFATANDALPQSYHKSDTMWVAIQVSHTPLTDRVDYFGFDGSHHGILSFPDDELRAPPSWHRVGFLDTVDIGFELQVGWPLRSFWCANIRRGAKGVLEVHGIPAPFAKSRVIPTRPIWPGFAVNTLFYAALLWFPFVLRRFIRVKRGLCPACAYPMGESVVCSECGKTLPECVKVTT